MMNRSTAARLGLAGAVAGLGLAAGGIAVASADDNSTDSGGTTSSEHPRGFGRHGGPGGIGGPIGASSENLAKELGVSEDKLRDAFKAVMEDLRPDRPKADGERPTPPTDAERDARQTALAKALAKELDLSEAKVSAAFEKLRDERRTDARDILSDRLDDAVQDGKLTDADKKSVLKAYDADVIGGFGFVK